METPPEKEEGVLLRTPTPKLTRLAEDNSRHSFAQPCMHPATVTQRLPDSHRHFARLTCAVCGCHLRWLPKTQTLERRAFNAFRLAKLSMCEGLTSWEDRFVRDVLKCRKLSPRQEALIARLVENYLSEGNAK
jgi:hypothetical protein